jgi:hypothetical protein
MPRTFLVPVDLNKNELRNPRMQQLASAPSSPVTGQFYYDTVGNLGYFWNGSSWLAMGSTGGAGIPATIVDVKGDLIVASAADTVVRKAAGANGTYLQAQSAQGDGLLWTSIADADLPGTIMRDAEHVVGLHTAYPLNTFAAPTADVAMGGFKITGLGDPVADTDAANKRYADGIAAGLAWKDSVRAASTGPLTISTGVNAGDVIDGVTLATGDRVLLKDQTAPAENGIYVTAASPARSLDADAAAEIVNASVWVEEGTANAESGWVMTTAPPITLGTTALAWVRFSGLGQITAGAGMTQTSNTLDVVGGTGMVANANDVAVLRTDTNGRVPLKFAQTFGDGAATSYNIDHNLNSLDVLTQVFKVSTGAMVDPDITVSTVNRVILGFTVAPTSNELRAVVYG